MGPGTPYADRSGVSGELDAATTVVEPDAVFMDGDQQSVWLTSVEDRDSGRRRRQAWENEDRWAPFLPKCVQWRKLPGSFSKASFAFI